MNSCVTVKGLTKTFTAPGIFGSREKILAVDNADMEIKRGSIFGLVGESGCGKTSLARCMLCLDPPDSGQVLLDGIDLSRLGRKELRRIRLKVQIVFQDTNSALNPRMKIKHSIAEGLENAAYPKAKQDERICELLDLVGIPPDHRSRYPHEFSGGQKQRIAIARALAVNADFLVLDEPVSSLDVSIQAQIINLLTELKQKLDLTYLFISHDLNLVSYFCDSMAVMHQGRIVEQGPADTLLNNPRHHYTQKLFASARGFNAEGTGKE